MRRPVFVPYDDTTRRHALVPWLVILNFALLVMVPNSVFAETDLPPTISIVSPAVDGVLFNPQTGVTVTATASDPENEFMQVEFFINGHLIGERFLAPPYTVHVTMETLVEGGDFTISAVATDTHSQTATATRNFVVGNLPPTNFTLTADREHVNMWNQMHANAFDLDGQIQSIEYYLTDPRSPESRDCMQYIGCSPNNSDYSWDAPHRGTYYVVARALDNDGEAVVSPSYVQLDFNPDTDRVKYDEDGEYTGLNMPPVVYPTLWGIPFEMTAGHTMDVTAFTITEGSITDVSFYGNYELIDSATESIAPDLYQLNIPWPLIKPGLYRESFFRAHDDQGGLGDFPCSDFVVVNPLPVFDAPVVVSESGILQASASDYEGLVTKIEVLINGQKVYDGANPCSYSLEGLDPGSYYYEVRAYDIEWGICTSRGSFQVEEESLQAPENMMSLSYTMDSMPLSDTRVMEWPGAALHQMINRIDASKVKRPANIKAAPATDQLVNDSVATELESTIPQE